MPLHDLTKQSVEQAIAEFDRLGRDQFLDRYGFGKARSYMLAHNGNHYDSKAIAGVAHGFLLHRVYGMSVEVMSRRELQTEDFSCVCAPHEMV